MPAANPFMPGMGTVPGHLAGRGEEREILAQVLDRIAMPRSKGEKFLRLSPWPPIKIIGARGTGKTALLRMAQRMAAERGLHAVFVGRVDDLTPNGDFYADLLAGLEKQPLVLLLDEAMDCDPDVLGRLLIMCKRMISYRYPLALLLAGTPRLEQTLVQARAGFMDLAKQIRIGLLAPAATAEALRKPFEDGGVKVQASALELMAGMTDGHPICTQVVGFEVWNAMAAAGREKVDRKTVKEAEAKIQESRKKFHQDVYDEMLSAKLIAPALHVMEILRLNGGKATNRTIISSLEERFAGNDGFDEVDVYNKLVDHGFIWRQGMKMEEGLPSFFSFCEAA